VGDLDVPVVGHAARHRDVGVALRGADARRRRHLPAHAARPVVAPPRVIAGDVEGQQVAVLEGEEPRLSFMRRLLYNQRSRPLVVRRENAALTHEA